MAKGTISLGTSGKLTGQIVWSSTSNGSVENSSYVSVELQIKKTSGSEATTGTFSYYLNIGGSSITNTWYGSIGTSWKTIGTLGATIDHNDNGTGSCSISGKVTGPSGTTLAGKTVSATQTVPLDTISRPSVLGTISNFTLGDSITIPITKYSSSFTDNLTVSLQNGTIIKTINNITNGYELNFSESELNKIYNSIPTSLKTLITFTLTTMNGSTQVGYRFSSVWGEINTDKVRPTFPTYTVTEANDVVPSDWGVFVKNKSKLKFVISASAGTGASISSITTKFDGKSYSGSTITTELIRTAGSLTVDISVTDSRGITSSSAKGITIVDYEPPYITSASAIRSDAGGTFDDNGTYLRVDLVAGVYPVEEHNTAIFQIRYKKTTEEEWTIKTVGDGYLTYNGYVRIPGLDTNSSYDVQVVVSDYFTDVVKTLSTIPTAFTTVDYLNGGHGIAFGKVAEEEDLMDINFNVKFNKGVEFSEVDYISQCTFTNCTLNDGKIIKIGQIVYVQISITATITHGWANLISIPEELRPFVIYDYGTSISGAECWVYDTGTAAVIRRDIEEGKIYNLVGFYIARI